MDCTTWEILILSIPLLISAFCPAGLAVQRLLWFPCMHIRLPVCCRNAWHGCFYFSLEQFAGCFYLGSLRVVSLSGLQVFSSSLKADRAAKPSVSQLNAFLCPGDSRVSPDLWNALDFPQDKECRGASDSIYKP